MAELNTFRELTDAEIDMGSGTDMAERGRPRIWDDLFDLELYKTVEAHRMSWMRRKLPSLASACKTMAKQGFAAPNPDRVPDQWLKWPTILGRYMRSGRELYRDLPPPERAAVDAEIEQRAMRLFSERQRGYMRN
jgi:hypothetical protein